MSRWLDREEYDREVMSRPRMSQRRIFLLIALELAFVAVVVLWAWMDAGRPVEATMPTIEVVSPSEAFYGERRDTSALARLCCRVSR